MLRKHIFISLFLFLSGYLAVGQAGYSTSSVHQNRSNAVFTPEQVEVKEYVNYHLHQIPGPKRHTEAALSMDHFHAPNGNLIIQVGIATRNEEDLTDKAPVNVCLVIDKSGSMRAENRMGKVKRALHKFIQGLRSWDYVSIVAYDAGARTYLPAQKVGHISKLSELIESIYPGGSTNLHQGLINGYREVQKNFSPSYTNKVILLTDGLVNTGITDLNQIAYQSASFNQMGIDVSTIGVGTNLNHQLLKKISEEGRGANHFIGDSEEDIAKVFEQELQSMLAPVGRNVSVELEVPYGYALEKVHGYDYNQPLRNTVNVPLKHINQGLTQVILFELRHLYENDRFNSPTFSSRLKYQSSDTKRNVSLYAEHYPNRSRYSNREVAKSYWIARMSSALKEMADLAQMKEFDRARLSLELVLADAKRNFAGHWDQDLGRVENILLKEMEDLQVFSTASGY